MMKAVDLDSDEGSTEEGESIAWRIFSNSKKSRTITEDSVLYPILKNLNQDNIVLTDLKSDQVKIIFKGIYDTDIVQGFYTAFRTVAWPMWWFGTGFISPGAIMFLGLFLLKLAIFATAAVSTAFLVLSTAFGILNIASNLFLKAKTAVYDQVAKDADMLQKMLKELELYLERRELAEHWMNEHVGENAVKLMELGGDLNDADRKEFENKLYVAMKSSLYSIDKNIKTNWFLNSALLRVLNVINNVFNAINSRVLFGFGCFIFVMMTINIFFPLSMPVILTVIALASVSAIIHTGLVASEMIDAERKHAENLSVVKARINELDTALDTFQEKLPSVLPLDRYKGPDDLEEDEVDNSVDELLAPTNKEKSLKATALEPSAYETKGYYQPRFIGSLSEVAQRSNLEPKMFDDFINYATTAPSA